MTLQQAAKIVKENNEYLALFDEEDGHEDLRRALHDEIIEAKRVLESEGIFAI